MKHTSRGFGQISLISFIALPILLIIIAMMGLKMYNQAQKFEDEKRTLTSAVKANQTALLDLRKSFDRSQAGIASVRLQTDAVNEATRRDINALSQLNLESEAGLNPQEVQDLVNVISNDQLRRLEEITQKDWQPGFIDNE
jgi:hypothetical protein